MGDERNLAQLRGGRNVRVYNTQLAGLRGGRTVRTSPGLAALYKYSVRYSLTCYGLVGSDPIGGAQIGMTRHHQPIANKDDVPDEPNSSIGAQFSFS